jgi:formylglycine-generating enzyme required for sulfatase activity
MCRRRLFLAALALLLAVAPAGAEGKKYAVVVGVGKYDHPTLSALEGPEKDVNALAVLLEKHGYQKPKRLTTADPTARPTRANVLDRLTSTLNAAGKEDLVLVALAGHGLQFDDDRDAFFCPTDAKPTRDRKDTLVSLKAMYDQAFESNAGQIVFLIDACRNDPVVFRGMDADGSPQPPKRVSALFSCSAGQKAIEHPVHKQGMFFHHVLKGLEGAAAPGRTRVNFNELHEHVAEQVQAEVKQLYGDRFRQTPNQRHGGYEGGSPVLVAGLVPDLPAVTREPKPGEDKEFEIAPGTRMKFCWVPKGTNTLRDKDGNARPYTSAGFWMGKFEVTQAEWAAVGVPGARPFFVRGKREATKLDLSGPALVSRSGAAAQPGPARDFEDLPMESVTFADCVAFINAAERHAPEKRAGARFRLPTEDQWEYACRGGLQDEPFHIPGGLKPENGNFDYPGKTFTGPRPVGSYLGKAAHPWNLFDMHGNVAEWCVRTVIDPGSTNVTRGGSYASAKDDCGTARRQPMGDVRSRIIGFRIILINE